MSATGGVLAFLTVIALSPRYFGIGIGEGGFALSVQRMISITLIALIIIALIFKSKKTTSYEKVFSPRIFLNTMILFFIISSASSLIKNPSSLYFVFGFTEDLINLFLSYLVVFYVYPIKESKSRFFAYLFLIPATISSGFILIELFKSEPVFSNLENSGILALRDPGEAKFRDGAYRAKALFDGPLILSEFAVYAWISVLFLWGAVEETSKGPRREINHLSLLVSGFLIIFCILSTGSRAGFAIAFVSTACFIIIHYTRKTAKKSSIFAVKSYVIFGIIIVSIYIYGNINSFEELKSFSQIVDKFDRSSYARTLQYFQVFSIIQDSPAIGFGYQRNYAARFESLYNIDNHYLRVILQAGFVGFFVFVFAIFVLLRSGLKMLASEDRQVSRIGVFLIVFGAAFLSQKLFLSQPDNNIYLYLVYFISIREANLSLGYSRTRSYKRRCAGSAHL